MKSTSSLEVADGRPQYPDDEDDRSMYVIGLGAVAVVCSVVWFAIGYAVGAF